MDSSQSSESSESGISTGRRKHSITDDGYHSYDSDVQPGQKRKVSTELQAHKKARKERESAFANVVRNVYAHIRDEGYVLFIENELSGECSGINILRKRLLIVNSSTFWTPRNHREEWICKYNRFTI